MQNRLNQKILPAVFTPTELFSPKNEKLHPHSCELVVFDLTYLHFHDSMELGYCLQGKGTCCVEGKEFPFQEGDVQIIFPYQKHLSKNIGKKEGRWYWINVDPCILLQQCGYRNASQIEQIMHREMGVYGIFSEKAYPEINRLVCNFFEEAIKNEQSSLHHSELCGLYIYELLIKLARISENLPKISMQWDKRMLSLAPALEKIEEGIFEGKIPNVKELARLCNQSESNFRKIFRTETGFSPKEYILQCQIHKAQRLLLSGDKSILEISEECGYENISGFNRQFLARNEISPSAYRKQFRKGD